MKIFIQTCWAGMVLMMILASVPSIAQEIAGFTLIDAISGRDIRPLKAGDTIDFTKERGKLNIRDDGLLYYEGGELNIRVDVQGEVGSVQFELDGQGPGRIESVAPFSIGGENKPVLKVTDVAENQASKVYFFDPEDDAFLEKGNPSNSEQLRVEANERVTYMKFNVSGLSGDVQSATLKLTENGDTGNGNLRIHKGSHNNWTEENITTANAPDKDGEIARRSVSVGEGQTIEIDVTKLITGNGVFSLVIEMDDGGNDIWFGSKESAVGDYGGWSLPPGKHSVTVVPFSGPGASGARGKTRTIAFTVVGAPGVYSPESCYPDIKNAGELGRIPPPGVVEGDLMLWNIFELTLKGPSDGNPFVDVEFGAEFKQGTKVFKPDGFYDGNGIYKVRFMPNATGNWTYITRSNCSELDGKKGRFTCTEAGPDNHGPVRVHNTFQLAYADGTPHFSVGTTCYAWVHQGDEMEAKTLETLKNAPFNKMRMCVFPKSYSYNKNEPEYYAYEGKPLKDWDFKRFNPAFWRHFEKRVGQLCEMGIEADIIIFHPYDRWGFENIGHENNLFYLRYLVARLAAFRNVWWSFANEYDLLKWPMEHWDEYMQLVQRIDPYDHLRGIHNCRGWYDHNKLWVTHCSAQNRMEFARSKEWRDQYHKPILYDECRYEGNISQGWGSITSEQMTRHFWMGSLAGCYVGHSETYQHPQDLLWWAKGGVLYGRSPARIQFMKDIIEEQPYQQMQPDFSNYPDVFIMAKKGECYLMYIAGGKPVTIELPGETAYKVDGIDTWGMKILPIGSTSPGEFTFAPPKQDYAIRLTKYAPGEKMRPEVN